MTPTAEEWVDVPEEDGATEWVDVPEEAPPAPVADAPSPGGPMLAALPETDEPELAPLPDNSTRLRTLFEEGLKEAPDRRAGILAVARRTGLPSDIVEARYDDFSRAAQAADFDADAFRRDFPTLADEMLRRPELGSVAPALQKQSGLIRLFGAAYRFLTDDQGLKEANDAAEARRKAGLPEEPLKLSGFPSMEELFPAPREVPTLVAPEAAATGLGRPIAILGAELGRASRLVERDRLGVALMVRRARGQDTWDVDKRLADLEEATIEREYGQGAFLQPLIETARQLPQQWEGLKTAGAAGVATTLGGAALGAATRRPGGVKLGAKLGARLGMAEGLFLSTFETAMGGAYLEMADVTADDGTPISEDVRAGAAIVRGLTEAGVEVATLGPFLRMFGAPGAALATASPRAFVQEAMKDAGKRQALASFGKRFLKGVGGESAEEATASLLGDVTTWVARSAEAGEGGTFQGQSFDWEASKLKAVEAAATAAVSTGVTGLAGNALTAGPQELYRRGAARRAEARVAAAIALGKESPLATAAPEALAQVIAQKAAETGESLTHLHIAAEPLQRFFQETFPDNPNAAAEFLGEDGVRQLQEALATGERFAVPVATYLEKWAKQPIAEALQPHTTTAPGHRTTAERQTEEADEAQIEAQARALADRETQSQAAADVQEDASSAEARLVDAPRASLEAAGLSKAEAAASVEPLRALLRTQAVRMGVPADVLFQQYGLTVTPGSEATSPLQADVDASFDFGVNAAAQEAAPVVEGQALDEARGVIARMRPDNRAMAEAWLAYTQGQTETRPAITPDMERQLARYGVVDPAGYAYDEGGRALDKPLGGRKVRGLEPDELRRIREDNVAHRLGEESVRYRQEVLAKGDSPAVQHLRGLWAKATTLEAKAEYFYRDVRTGLLNPSAWRRLRPDPTRPLVALVSVEGLKHTNDTYGHDAGDALFREAAQAVYGISQEAAKLGGDFGLRIADAKDFQARLAEAGQREGLQGRRLIGAVGATVEEARAELKKTKAAAEAAGDWTSRGARPTTAVEAEGQRPAYAAPKVEGAPLPEGLLEELGRMEADKEKPDAAFLEAFIEPSGLLTEAGWFNREKKKYQAKMDLNGLAAANALGFKLGDAMIAGLGRYMAKHGGARFAAAHISGDEYAAQSDDKAELEAWVAELTTQARAGIIAVRDRATGDGLVSKGLSFGAGIGEDSDAAEKGLNKHKDELSAAGERGEAADARRLERIPAAQLRARLDSYRRGSGVGRGAGRPGDAGPADGVERLEQSATPQTETPAFRAWFKESKVVDAEGKPLLVLHGTNASGAIDAFTTEGAGRNELSGLGAWFAEDAGVANNFATVEETEYFYRDAGGNEVVLPKGTYSAPNKEDVYFRDAVRGQVYPAFLSLQNPLILESTPELDALDRLRQLRHKHVTYYGGSKYDWDSRMAEKDREGATEAFRKELEEQGYDGIILRGTTYDANGKPGEQFVAFKPGQIKSATGNRGTFDPNDPSILRQETAGKITRGYVDMRREGMKRVFDVVLNPEANLSTFLHESGHTFLEIMGDLAAREDAPQQLRDDYRTALEHLGVNTREEIGREQHELFARSFETWLLEGNAPSVGLARFFQRFKLWLMRIYRQAAALNAPLSPEIRGVFDRLFATDEEIARARSASGLQPLFRSPEEAGMSPEAWATYLREQEAAVSSATQATQHRVLKDRLRETESWWKAEEKGLREAARTEYDARPDAQAAAYIRKGVLQGEEGEAPKLDRDAAYAALGEARAKLLLRGRLERDGESPDTVAELFGYPTGKAMLEALESLPEREAWARETAAQRMREKYPDILEEKDRLGEAAQKHLHTEATGGWLVREWKALREKAGEAGDPPLEAIRRAARLIVERRPVRRLDVGRALAAERSAATKAAVAAAKGQYREAYVLQQQRLLNFYLHRELTKARDDRATFEEQLSDMQTPRRRSQLGLGGAAFLGTSDSILEAVGAKDVGEDVAAREGLDALLARLESEGLAPAFDAAALRALLAQPKEWKELTVDEMRNTSDALKQLRKLARATQVAMVEGQRRAVAELAAEIAREAEHRPDKGPAPASSSAAPRFHWAKQRWEGLGAAHIEPEFLLDRLGPTAHKYFWGGYLQGRTTEDKLADRVLRFFVEKWDALPKAMQARRYDLVDASGLPIPEDVNLGGARDRQWMWMVWLNRGSGSNLERLLGGYGWTQGQVDTFLAANMTKEEADFLQGIHDLMDKELYPEMARAYEATNGVKPSKVKAIPIEMPFGTYAGGYVPAKYSPVASRLGMRQAETAVANLFGGASARASVSKGFTKERAKVFTDVIDLNWSVVPSHVAQVVHYVAFDGFVREAARVLFHPDMAMALQRRLGLKYQQQLEAWLKVVASAQADAVPETIADVLSVLGAGRSRFVMASIGYSLSVAAGDFANPLLPVARGDVKAKYMAPALASIRNFPAMRKRAKAKSPELRHRSEQMASKLKRELGDVGGPGKITGVGTALEKARELAFKFMEWTDKLTSTIVWEAGYRQALAEGKADGDAVASADRVVRNTFPSNDLAEQSALLRDKRSIGALLAFYGYFSKVANGIRDVWEEPRVEYRKAEGASETLSALPDLAGAAARTLAILFVTGVVSEFYSGRGPEDDEDDDLAGWVTWALRKLLVAPFGMVPLVGGVGEAGANAVVDKMLTGEVQNRPISVRAAPAAAAVQRLWKAIADAANSGKGDWERVGRALEAAGVMMKLPVSQPQRTIGYWWEVGANPPGAADALSGTIYGKRERQGANPLSVVSGAGGP